MAEPPFRIPAARPFVPAAPAIIPAGKRVMLEVGPMLESHWTGIPVFTRRLAQALLADRRLNVSFCYNLAEIPRDKLIEAIRVETGTFLRQDIEQNATRDYRPASLSQPVIYPSVKESFGTAVSEACTVHDISTLVMPDNHEDANISYHMDVLARSLATDHATFCVSEATQSALETYFPSVRGKTRVLYQYVDWPTPFAMLDHNMPRIQLGRYAVVIGTIEPRKNLAILLRALAHDSLAKSDLKFVVIGKLGWLVDQFMEDLTPAQRERVIFTGFVSEFIKYRLIAAAEFMVYPSLYEGFGIPALEALSLGKPILAARTSSFPEVIGNAGVYFDPLSIDEFAAGLAEIETPSRLAELSTATHAQAKQFNAQRMADAAFDFVNQG